ncbi:gamma-glutamylcyclotransferase family protein [Bradyrhizobium japonicum]|uniref:gamma-glutamylcyclotransferase family protein n=1 Tax=Bradyrhizobium japonicum TaxID=375 RepID=UPI002714EAAD|nr:gamma-glutamylcyclotransferase family protein [Bradyrhizobium japonicum]WLB57433.1 gamma-glutamylcyclotransferase family protein [Bradyrhizobium japonicum]
MTQQIKYFAYGSNMCSGRLGARISCTFVTIGKLVGHQLRFHKLSKDGSAKCDALRTGSDSDAMWGVVYDIPASEKPKLDREEGLGKGYEDAQIVVELADGTRLEAVTYVAAADAVRKGVRPFTWYKAYVEAGAEEHSLPEDYIAAIRSVEAVQDSDGTRHEAQSFQLEQWKQRLKSVGGEG